MILQLITACETKQNSQSLTVPTKAMQLIVTTITTVKWSSRMQHLNFHNFYNF